MAKGANIFGHDCIANNTQVSIMPFTILCEIVPSKFDCMLVEKFSYINVICHCLIFCCMELHADVFTCPHTNWSLSMWYIWGLIEIQTLGSMGINRILYFRAVKEASCALSMVIVVLRLCGQLCSRCRQSKPTSHPQWHSARENE